MARKKIRSGTPIYQLKVTLKYVEPPIWRRIEVPGSARLDDLHLMIQAAMGWDNCHLHDFRIGPRRYGIPDADFGTNFEDERKYRLADVAPTDDMRILYTYDFGDNWEHDVVVEKISPAETGVEYPRCVAGARACPPEDVGSVPGYAQFLEAICDPGHEDHDDMIEWVGGEFDPEAFDVDVAREAVWDYKSMQAEAM